VLTTINWGSVAEIGEYAFTGCLALKSIDLPEGITIIGSHAFDGCTTLQDAYIPASVGQMGSGVFNGCSRFESVMIKGNVPDSAFRSCSALRDVSCGDETFIIAANAFSGCSSLESLFIPASVTKIGSDCFEDCYSISSIVVDENNKVFDSRNNCNAIIQTREKSLILGCKNTVIPNSIMSIGGGAFSGCKELKEISMPDTVGLIIGYAFKNCTGLSSVNLGKSLKEICSSAFYGCTSLTHIIIPKSVQKIQQTNGYAYIPFYYCKNLKSIVVEDGNRFYDSRDNCNAIIVSTNTDLSKDTLIVLCSSTIVPATVTRISISAIECPKNLTSISVAEGNTCYDSRDNSKAIIQISEADYPYEPLATKSIPVVQASPEIKLNSNIILK
jgi:hypothetical protein